MKARIPLGAPLRTVFKCQSGFPADGPHTAGYTSSIFPDQPWLAGAMAFLLIFLALPRGTRGMGNDNPTGPAGEYNGAITTAGYYDPYTGNAKRVIDDIVVPGSVGAYPLKWTRYNNSRGNPSGDLGAGGAWTHSYDYGVGFHPTPPPTCHANECYPRDEDGMVGYPDGRLVGTYRDGGGAYPPSGTYVVGLAGEDQAQDRVVVLSSSPITCDLLLADGGRLEFRSIGGQPAWVLTSIVDPFGLVTTLAYEPGPQGRFRLSRITEPGGKRYLQITYEQHTCDYYYGGQQRYVTYDLIKKVEAFALGVNTAIDSVTYDYVPQTLNQTQLLQPYCVFHLAQATYADGTQAQYTYKKINGETFSWRFNPHHALETCKDPRYPGPMREIGYGFFGQDASGSCRVWGQIWREKNGDNQVVSELELPACRDACLSLSETASRTEKRADLPETKTRTVQYKCRLGFGSAELWKHTDFEGNDTIIEWLNGHTRKKITDARLNVTYVDRDWQIVDPLHSEQNGLGLITRVEYPGGAHVDYTYNPPRYLATTTDERGNRTQHTRNQTTHLIERTDYYGRVNNSDVLLAYETFQYDPLNQVTKHRMKNGAYEHFRYDSRGLLIDKWVPTWSASPVESDPKTHYTYYQAGDPIGGNAWIDRVKTETDPRGNVIEYEYDHLFVNDTPTSTPAPGRGLITKITYRNDTHNGQFSGGTSRSFVYNKYGDKISETNEANETTKYVYDLYGRVTSVEDPRHSFETFDYLKPGTSSSYLHTTKSVFHHESRAHKITTNDYDANWRKTKTTAGVGSSDAATTWFDYDAVGNQTKITDPRGSGPDDSRYTTITHYDERNRKDVVTEPLVTGETNNHVTTFHYDDTNNVLQIDRPDGTHEFKQYDGLNRVIKHKVPMLGQGPDSDYVITDFIYYPNDVHSAGLLHIVKDGNGHETEFEYEPSGLKEKMYYPVMNGRDTQTWAYDANKNLISRTTVGGRTQTFSYDARNRKTSMRWSNQIDWSDFKYDAAGRLNWAQNPYSIINRHYDPAGRMEYDQQTFPASTPTPLPIIHPRVVSLQTQGTAGTFDILLPLTGEPGIESRSGGPEGRYTIVATFDQPVTFDGPKVISGIGYVDTFSSVPNGTGGTEITIELVKVSDAQQITILLSGVNDGEHIENIEIPMHVLVGDVTGRGVVKESDVALVDVHDGETVSANNFVCDVNGDGLIDAYDAKLVAANAGSELDSGSLGTTVQVNYGYDDDGRVTQLSIPGTNYAYTQTYDGMGRLQTIYKTGVHNFLYTYDPASNVRTRVNSMNGTTLDYGTRDELNRITNLRINVPTPPNSRSWFTHEHYEYDEMNRLKKVTREEEPSVWDQFEYYLDGELKSAKYQWAEHIGPSPTPGPGENPGSAPRNVAYTLDKLGNRTHVNDNGISCTYVPNEVNQYSSINQYGSIAIVNGPEHEISQYGTVQYSYLNDTRLAEVVSTSDAYSLGYDALGRCVRRSWNGKSEMYYVYDGERPIYEFDPGNTAKIFSMNVYGIGIDEIIARTNNGAAQYPMQDHEGSVIVVTGGNGEIKEWYRYDAFGAPTIFHWNAATSRWETISTTQINNRFLFTGREYAEKFGFYEYRARAYHPTIGRFMSEDPGLFVRGMGLGKAPDKWSFSAHPDEAELNLFRYCNNDPWDLVDPMGRFYIKERIDDTHYVISIPIKYEGPGNTAEARDSFKSGIESLSGKYAGEVNGKQAEYNVKFQVTEPKSGQPTNTVYVAQGVGRGSFGTEWGSNRGAWFAGGARDVGGVKSISPAEGARHSVGHFLGFKDAYEHGTYKTSAGFEGHLMNYRPGGAISVHDMNKILNRSSFERFLLYYGHLNQPPGLD